jgi:hypothetical protein
MPWMSQVLYLDQNYLSGLAKRKPSFCELEPVLRNAIAAEVIEVVESDVHALESGVRPDLGLLELLRELSGGRRLPSGHDHAVREARRRWPGRSSMTFLSAGRSRATGQISTRSASRSCTVTSSHATPSWPT